MKKVVTILLAALYMGVATGATVQLHYCMDKLAEMNLVKNNRDTCSQCGMKKGNKSCCKDEVKVVKLGTDHKASYSSFDFVQNSVAILPIYSGYTFKDLSTVTESYPVSHAPPPASSLPLFIRHCVYRI